MARGYESMIGWLSVPCQVPRRNYFAESNRRDQASPTWRGWTAGYAVAWHVTTTQTVTILYYARANNTDCNTVCTNSSLVKT